MTTRGPQETLEWALSAPALVPAQPILDESAEDTANGPAGQWLRVMSSPDAGLHEKMVWFWHGKLTSSIDKVDNWALMWNQHLLLRRLALGNFRELMHAVTVDGAMLQYLDGASSTADGPNENYAREMMELFCLGRGNYTQRDVRGAATALAGWTVDDDTGATSFDRAGANTAPTTVLGRSVVDAHDVVDVVCDQPACARFIATAMHRYLAGVDPTPGRCDQLATIFRAANLEIRPLVTAIVTDPSFLEMRLNRPRFPVEWVVSAMAVAGLTDMAMAYDALNGLGQVPFQPPNVAGWPPGPQWATAPSRAVARAALAVGVPALPALAAESDLVKAAFERAGIVTPSATTTAAARQLADALPASEPSARAAAVVALVLSSPEFALA